MNEAENEEEQLANDCEAFVEAQSEPAKIKQYGDADKVNLDKLRYKGDKISETSTRSEAGAIVKRYAAAVKAAVDKDDAHWYQQLGGDYSETDARRLQGMLSNIGVWKYLGKFKPTVPDDAAQSGVSGRTRSQLQTSQPGVPASDLPRTLWEWERIKARQTTMTTASIKYFKQACEANLYEVVMREFATRNHSYSGEANLLLWNKLVLLTKEILEVRSQLEVSVDMIVECRKDSNLNTVLSTAINYGKDYHDYSERMRKRDIRKGVFSGDTITTLATFGCNWETLSLEELADKFETLPRSTMKKINATIHFDPSNDLLKYGSSASSSKKTNSSKKRGPCKFFMKGHCKKGAACSFSHIQGSAKTKLPDSRRTENAKRARNSRGAGNGSNNRERNAASNGTSQSDMVCYKFHKKGHSSRQCSESACPCGDRGKPTSKCPRSDSHVVYSMPLVDNAFNSAVIGTDACHSGEIPIADTSGALKVKALFHVLGEDDFETHPVLLDTGADVNLVGSHVAHDVQTINPVKISTGGGVMTLSQAGRAMVKLNDFADNGLRSVRAFVLPEGKMPKGAALLLSRQAIDKLRISLDGSMKKGSRSVKSDLSFPVLRRTGRKRPKKRKKGKKRNKVGSLSALTTLSGIDEVPGWASSDGNSDLISILALPELQTSKDCVHLPFDDYMSNLEEVKEDISLDWIDSNNHELWWSELKAAEFLAENPVLQKTFTIDDIAIAPDISSQLASRIRKWATKYDKIFAKTSVPPLSKEFIKRKGPVDMIAELKPDAKPVHVASRTFKPNERKLLTMFTQQMLDAGGMVRNPDSPWASYIHIVDNKGVKPRFVVDLRMLNDRTRWRKTTMPSGERQAERASVKAKFHFSTDAIGCYTQFGVTKESLDLNTVHTPLGKMAFTRMLMGYAPSARVQQHYYTEAMDSMAEHARNHTANFADDFVIWADSEDQLMQFLEEFASMCVEFGISLSPKKTKIGGPSTNTVFYGSEILSFDKGGGLVALNDRVKALKETRSPTSVKEVRSVIGMLNFCRRLVPQFSSRIAPLTKLTKQNYFKGTSFHFPDEAENAMRSIINDLCNGAARHTMITTSPLRMDVDASRHGWGAHVWQEVKNELGELVPQTIAWLSKQWPPSLRSRPSFVLETHALFAALKAVRPWAYAHPDPVRVRTDARSIEWVYKQPSGPVAGYAAAAAAETPFTLEYLPGPQNVVADALSRPPLVGPQVLSNDGLEDMLQLLLGQISNEFQQASSLWVQAKSDTDVAVKVVRNCSKRKQLKVMKRTVSQENIASAKVDLAIVVPEAGRSPGIARSLLASDLTFAVLMPHDLIPQIARTDDGVYDEKVAADMTGVTFIGSATAMFTWVYRTKSDTRVPHHLVMALTAPDPSEIPTDGTFPASLANYLDVLSWIGYQNVTVPRTDKGTILTRSDNLKLYVGTDGMHRIVVPAALETTLILAAHQELRHLKDRYVLFHLRQHFWFPKMSAKVRQVISQCADCQLSNANRLLAHGDHHAPAVHAPRTRWQIDSKKVGDQHILACIDTFSGYIVLIPIPDRTAVVCAEAFIQEVILIFGVPHTVRVDSARSFGRSFANMLGRFGISVTATEANHPQGNSHVERAWKQINRHFMVGPNAGIEQMGKSLRMAAWAHNVSVKPYGYSPFEVMFGTRAMSPMHQAAAIPAVVGSEPTDDGTANARQTTADPAQEGSVPTDDGTEAPSATRTRVDELVNVTNVTIDNCAAAGKLIRDAATARLNARGRGVPVVFQVGDKVALHRDPSGKTGQREGRVRALVPKWIGPGVVTQCRGHGMYSVKVGRRNYGRHVSALKPFHGPLTSPVPATPAATASSSNAASQH